MVKVIFKKCFDKICNKTVPKNEKILFLFKNDRMTNRPSCFLLLFDLIIYSKIELAVNSLKSHYLIIVS